MLRLLATILAISLLDLSSASAQQIDAAAPGRRVALAPRSVSYGYADRDNLVFGVAGDTHLVFVSEPLTRRIAVLDRFTGAEVGQVPGPPAGFLLPFSLRVPGPGRLVVLDSGGFPNPSEPSVARVYDYAYAWNARSRAFTASLVRTVSFAGLPLVFAEDVEVTSSGLYVVAESVIGALWVVRPDGSITPGLFPVGGVPIPELAPCTMQPTTVGGIPFALAGNFAPGVVSLASRDEQLFFGTTCNGGLYRVPVQSLVDPLRSPAQRAQDIVAVSPRPAGTVETFHGLAVNRFDPRDTGVYVADSFRLRILRVDPRTGAREVIAGDPVLFNFPAKLQFLPPLGRVSPLVVASDQEHRLAAINAALTADQLQPPWVVTKVVVFDDD
jgi:hypothetical protein